MPARRTEDPAARFWRHVERRGECWIWTGAIAAGTGYGVFNRGGGALVGAHRFAWELAHPGQSCAGLVVRHECDTPPCVNPRHLVVGTHRDNTADMDARGRRRSNPPRGDSHPGARLTAERVRRARAASVLGARPGDLARIFGVSASTMAAALSRRTWSDA